MQQQLARRYVQNRIHQVSEYCQLLVPKQLNLDEYKLLISQPVFSSRLGQQQCFRWHRKSKWQSESILIWTAYKINVTQTPTHLDDHGLFTTSFHVAGATKVWITIAPKDKSSFQKLVQVSLPSQFKKRRSRNFQILVKLLREYLNNIIRLIGLLIQILIHSVDDRVAHSVADRVVYSVVDRVAHSVAARVAHSVADRVAYSFG
ncbi:unnamed protein product [Allacma fusca]|uniref:JmjC domain-containing protein n=1 Tax=Allacma fusca TaxID=39272 RepID=A0A8J2PB04_9HEXA|nr:unnamed protein product [Allacma fusca]